jgi:glycosyltransferase involved in cell wall biosynthesis
MRLLQTMAGAVHGGAEGFFERLALGLAHAGETQRLVIREDAARAQRLCMAGLKVVELPFGGLLDFKTRSGLKREIAEFGPRVVLSWMNRATRFCPRGDFVHAARLGGYYDLKYYKHCDHLIGNTHGIVDYLLAQGWPAERVHYLPNFVSIVPAPPIARAEFATPEDAPLVLGLGRLHKNKGFDVLIAAIATLPGFHLWLAGEGPEESALKTQASRLGVSDRVHFLGWREDISALLASVTMFVCSSRHEPLGNVVIEAWAAGVPVVSTASDGPRELIQDGETGLLVPIENADALAGAMKKLATSTGTRMHLATGGHEAYEKEFSEERVIALYRDFLEHAHKE